MKLDRTTRKRRQVARLAERCAVPERPWVGRGARYLVQPNVALACAPSLRTIAAALREETREIDETRVASVWTFLTTIDSPFRNSDAAAALSAVVVLRHSIVGTVTAGDEWEETAIAA